MKSASVSVISLYFIIIPTPNVAMGSIQSSFALEAITQPRAREYARAFDMIADTNECLPRGSSIGNATRGSYAKGYSRLTVAATKDACCRASDAQLSTGQMDLARRVAEVLPAKRLLAPFAHTCHGLRRSSAGNFEVTRPSPAILLAALRPWGSVGSSAI